MSVTIRPYRRGGWHVDIRLRLPDGTPFRKRTRISASKSVARRWGQERERHLLLNGLPKPAREVPTLEEFAPRFLDAHARANQHKASGITQMPCSIRLLKVSKCAVAFYDFDEYDRLVIAGRRIGVETYLLVLLSGEAGLRSGEMTALEWSDIDLGKGLLCVQRNAGKGRWAHRRAAGFATSV